MIEDLGIAALQGMDDFAMWLSRIFCRHEWMDGCYHDDPAARICANCGQVGRAALSSEPG